MKMEDCHEPVVMSRACPCDCPGNIESESSIPSSDLLALADEMGTRFWVDCLESGHGSNYNKAYNHAVHDIIEWLKKKGR